MTQTLYLLRHAKADPWSPGCNDFDRQLSDRGRRHMKKLAVWMKGNVQAPKSTLCSSSARTIETLDPVRELWPLHADTLSYRKDIYLASAGTLHSLAEEAFMETDSVMMIGHNPGFESMAFHFIPPGAYSTINKMATGTLGVFNFPSGYAMDAGDVELTHWIRRKDLRSPAGGSGDLTD